MTTTEFLNTLERTARSESPVSDKQDLQRAGDQHYFFYLKIVNYFSLYGDIALVEHYKKLANKMASEMTEQGLDHPFYSILASPEEYGPLIATQPI